MKERTVRVMLVLQHDTVTEESYVIGSKVSHANLWWKMSSIVQ